MPGETKNILTAIAEIIPTLTQHEKDILLAYSEGLATKAELLRIIDVRSQNPTDQAI